MTIAMPKQSASEILELLIGDVKVQFDAKRKSIYRPYRYTGKDIMPTHRDDMARRLVMKCKEYILIELERRVDEYPFEGVALKSTFREIHGNVKKIVDKGFVEILALRKGLAKDCPINANIPYNDVNEFFFPFACMIVLFPLVGLVLYFLSSIIDLFLANDFKPYAPGSYFWCTRTTCVNASLKLLLIEEADAVFSELRDYVRTVKDVPPPIVNKM